MDEFMSIFIPLSIKPLNQIPAYRNPEMENIDAGNRNGQDRRK